MELTENQKMIRDMTRDFARSKVAPIARETTVWPAMFLVYRYRHDTRFIDERILDAVAVMRIEVDVHHPVQILAKQRSNGEDRIIEIAKATRPVPPSMVRAARRVKHDVTLAGQPGRQD